MKLAVEGCCHGELDTIYDELHRLESQNHYKVDALLICGDFEAIRNHQDLECKASPNKYKRLQTFYKYYTGEKIAPVLTLVIGGNHEASNYFSELYHGGWLAPNIYYLGCAGSVLLNGVRITGMSGIFKPNHFHMGHHERLPYTSDTLRSVYHVREFNVRRITLLPTARIFLSHDWPQSIEQHGDLDNLLRMKPSFRESIDTGTLGCPPFMGVLRALRPEWWFAAHMHLRFEATVVHEDESAKTDVSSKNKAQKQHPGFAKTHFLALDKCLPKRNFFEVVDIETTPSSLDAQEVETTSDSATLSFDPLWLAITKAFQPWHSTSPRQPRFPDEPKARALVEKELKWVNQNITRDDDGNITVNSWQTFKMTAPGPGLEGDKKHIQPSWFKNPQTEAFCKMLQIENKIDPVA